MLSMCTRQDRTACCWQAEHAAEPSALEAEADLPLEQLLAMYPCAGSAATLTCPSCSATPRRCVLMIGTSALTACCCWQAEHAAELSALEAEADLPLDQLLAMYRGAGSAAVEPGPSAPFQARSSSCLCLARAKHQTEAPGAELRNIAWAMPSSQAAALLQAVMRPAKGAGPAAGGQPCQWHPCVLLCALAGQRLMQAVPWQAAPVSAAAPAAARHPAAPKLDKPLKGEIDAPVQAVSVEDAAAMASSAQPTGYTLQTTSVHTKVLLPAVAYSWQPLDGTICIFVCHPSRCRGCKEVSAAPASSSCLTGYMPADHLGAHSAADLLCSRRPKVFVVQPSGACHSLAPLSMLHDGEHSLTTHV